MTMMFRMLALPTLSCRTQRRDSLFLLLVVACCLLHNSLSFSLLPPITRTTRRSPTLLFADERTIRAGADGYSVLRQPASWDLDADPEFDVPSNLNQDKESPHQLDDDWWASRRDGRPSQPQQQAPKEPSTRQPESTSTTSQPTDDLDLFQRSLDTLDYPRVLRDLQAECTTVPAQRLVQESLAASNSKKVNKNKIPANVSQAFQPLLSESMPGSQERYRAVQEMQWILQGGHGNVRLDEYTYHNGQGYKESLAGRPPPLGGHSFNLETRLEQATTVGRVLEGPDILEISSMIDTMQDLISWGEGLQQVEGISFVELPKLVSCISVNTTLQELLHDAFDQDGRLSGSTFPTIGRLRARIRSLKGDIMDTLDSILAMPSMQSKLAVESGGPLYSEVSGGRLVVPIDTQHASSVGIVHDTSRSGKTVYVEPTEIVAPTNELRQTEGELRAEEARVWRSLTADILINRMPLETSVAAVGQLDLVLARYALGQKLSGVIPEVQNEGVISVRNAKHPVLLLRNVDNVVGSDVDLGANGNQGLVLTGPNAGGKTVILKLLGLYALLARGGIPIPADAATDDYHSRVDFFNPVLADIGDLQSVGGDLSTFSGHMLVCREVLANSGKNALVLLDELGSGTDPAQGVAIAQALLEELMEKGARVAITTHYMQLKQLATSDERFAVAGMQFVNGRPTYRLLPGTVGESFALAVAERLELPTKVIERANELLDSETRQMGDLIRSLEDQNALLDEQAAELEEKRKEIAATEFKIKEEKVRLEKKQLSARRDEAKKFAKQLEEKEQILENILEKLKSDPSRRIVAKSWEDIKFVKRDALNEAENVPSVVARKKRATAAIEEAQSELVPLAEMREKPNLKEGDSLIVYKKGPLFGREATVTKVLGGRVEVRVNNMNVGFKLTELALPTKKSGSPPNRGSGRSKVNAISKAAEKAIAAEANGKRSNWESSRSPTDNKPSGSSLAMRTESNTVDVRGCNLAEAKEKVKDKFSSSLMTGRPVVFILHGHGTGGVLKSKIRNWLKSERQLVKRWQPAAASDGGNALTQVELR